MNSHGWQRRGNPRRGGRRGFGGNLGVRNRDAVAGCSNENSISLRDSNGFGGGPYIERNRMTKGTIRKNANDEDGYPTPKKLRGNPGRGGRPHRGGRREFGGNTNANHKDNSPRMFQYGHKALENLLVKPPEEIILDFLGKKDFLQKLMASKMEPDVIVLLTRAFATACSSKFTANTAEILVLVLDDKYLQQLLQYVVQLPLQDTWQKGKNKAFWDKVEEFWGKLWFLFSQLLERVPTTTVDLLPKLVSAAVYTLQNFETQQNVVISEETSAKFKELQERLVSAREVKESEGGKKGACDGESPPEDFRELSIYPKPEELSMGARPFVRKNVVEGSYRDVDHYLDVQFRLLREDFVAPLREGIKEYLNLNLEGKKRRLSNIKIYTKVKCVGLETVENQIGNIVQVLKRGQIKDVEHTKRFMFGSLVCFTTDNFRTILFGKVINRDKPKLQLGQVVVGFDLGVSLDWEVEYTMAECTVYFEPYYQVLSALQKMDSNDFPLKKYLVDVNFVSEPPLYILQSPVFNIESFKVNVLQRESWPRHEEMRLNESQFEAFNFALNNKMCVIQGPPGTGKTYLALQIAKTLLENHEKWKCFGPILLICYTNHALDQFLEGLLDTTDQIVRVGGRSKSEKLLNFNIKEQRRKKSYITGKSVLREEMFVVRHSAANVQEKVQLLDQLNKFDSIIRFSEFDKVDEKFKTSWFALNEEDNIVKWLLEESNQDEWASLNRNIEPIESLYEEEIDDGYIDERTQNIVDIEDEFLKSICEHYKFGMVSMAGLQKRQQYLWQQMRKLRPNTSEHFEVAYDYNRTVINTEYLKYRLHQLRAGQLNAPPTKIDLNNPYRMSFDDRWRLYAAWMTKYKEHVENRIRAMDKDYRVTYTKYKEIREMSDTSLLRENQVIGMTTTGAAKLQTLLQALKCPIVIVEEAAEVLESHVITALTGSCQQLLLIGDHKQLRPSTADYKMDVHYNLGISLFERLIKNNFPCNTLNVQHRMRPEIAALVAPTIYPDLRNHHSVLNFKEIKGIDKSLYFITHQHAEKESADQSKENSHEVTFLLQLARYLVLNGYKAEKITLLAAYSGQMFRLLKERREYSLLKDLNIKVLDNYQGEENDIILLSLVRNNTEEKIGFLHLENRVCVALSRARKGMYVMGNMDLLCQKSKIWPKIREVLERQNAIGDSLLLRCQNHPDQVTEAKCENDFKKVPEGSCMKMCETMMECGHKCDRLCHIQSHDQLRCKEPCTKIICEFNHVCPKKCYEECDDCMVPKPATLPCGHKHKIPCHLTPEDVKCLIEIEATLPCGHTARKVCHLDVNEVRCGAKCDVRVEPCGHSCLRNCHISDDPDHEQYKCMKRCERQNKNCSLPEDTSHKCRKKCYEDCSPCYIRVGKTKTVCQHKHMVNCSENVDEIECMRRCTKTLPCGHKCKRNCNEVCGGCKEMVEKVVDVCGHTVKCACSVTPTHNLCGGKCELLLKCGHKCTRKCRENCDSVKCQQLVTASNVSCPNGHNLTVPCHLSQETILNDKLLRYCSEKCNVQLACGHSCSGTCGSCAQGRVHADCKEKCNKILVCGHECPAPCRSECQPCALQCSYRCGHGRCQRRCGEWCKSCWKPCQRRCPHVRCRNRCYQICEVGPCIKPCPKKLKCGHKCIGFCGDKCPPLCRTCDAETVTESFFGTEDDEKARFVYLPDCKHVVESSGFEQWIQTCYTTEGDNKISVIRCPKCKELVTCLQRYDEFLKSSLEDVKEATRKFNGNAKENDARMLITLLEKVKQVSRLCPALTKLGATKLFAELKFTLEKSKYRINQQQLQSYGTKIQILQQVCDTYSAQVLTKNEAQKIVQEHVNFLLGYLYERHGLLNNQRREDLEWELKRFTRVVQLAKIVEQSDEYFAHPEYKKCRDLALSFMRYNNEIDEELKKELSELSRKTLTNLVAVAEENNNLLPAIIALN